MKLIVISFLCPVAVSFWGISVEILGTFFEAFWVAA